ncbi:hypothetical protein CS542_05055 [Pedobacter sp. IW39]|nr:hypothetical protein CS542_05055 [Pedobacter sp. IW39]
MRCRIRLLLKKNHCHEFKYPHHFLVCYFICNYHLFIEWIVWYFANEFAFEDFYKRLGAGKHCESDQGFGGTNTFEYERCAKSTWNRLQEENRYLLQIKPAKCLKNYVFCSFYKNIESQVCGRLPQ